MKAFVQNVRSVCLAFFVFEISLISYAGDTNCYIYKPAEDARSCWDLAEELDMEDDWAPQHYCKGDPATETLHRIPKIVINMGAPCTLPGGGGD